MLEEGRNCLLQSSKVRFRRIPLLTDRGSVRSQSHLRRGSQGALRLTHKKHIPKGPKVFLPLRIAYNNLRLTKTFIVAFWAGAPGRACGLRQAAKFRCALPRRRRRPAVDFVSLGQDPRLLAVADSIAT